VEWLRKAREIFPPLLDTLALSLTVFQVGRAAAPLRSNPVPL